MSKEQDTGAMTVVLVHPYAPEKFFVTKAEYDDATGQYRRKNAHVSFRTAEGSSVILRTEEIRELQFKPIGDPGEASGE